MGCSLPGSSVHGIFQARTLEWVAISFNGNVLQCSCLENPVDGGAWWIAIHGVAQSRTQLSDLACMHVYRLYFIAVSFHLILTRATPSAYRHLHLTDEGRSERSWVFPRVTQFMSNP